MGDIGESAEHRHLIEARIYWFSSEFKYTEVQNMFISQGACSIRDPDKEEKAIIIFMLF